MASAAQITANRTNAQLSTRPRTPDGKANSARNRNTDLCIAARTPLPAAMPASLNDNLALDNFRHRTLP